MCFVFPRTGTALYAHKALLAARSLTFSMMFGSKGDGSGTAEGVRWRRVAEKDGGGGGAVETFAMDYDAGVFRKLLAFMYGGHVRLRTRAEARQLLELASHYSLDTLIAGCARAVRHDYTIPCNDLLTAMFRKIGRVSNTYSTVCSLYAKLKAAGVRTVTALADNPGILTTINTPAAVRLGMSSIVVDGKAFANSTATTPFDVYENYEHFVAEIESIADKSAFSDLTFVISSPADQSEGSASAAASAASSTSSGSSSPQSARKTVAAHRFIFACMSPYFQKVLQTPFLPAPTTPEPDETAAAAATPKDAPPVQAAAAPAAPVAPVAPPLPPEPARQVVPLDEPDLDRALDAFDAELQEHPIDGVPNSALWATIIANLLELGFTRHQAAAALLANNMDSDRAAEDLLRSPDRHVGGLRAALRTWRLRATPSLAQRSSSSSSNSSSSTRSSSSNNSSSTRSANSSSTQTISVQEWETVLAAQRQRETQSVGAVVPYAALAPVVPCARCHAPVRRADALRSAACSHACCRDCWLRRVVRTVARLHAPPHAPQHALAPSVFAAVSVRCVVPGCARRLPLASVLAALHLDSLGAAAGCTALLAQCARERASAARARRERPVVNVILPLPGLAPDVLVLYAHWLGSGRDCACAARLLRPGRLAPAAQPDRQLLPLAELFEDAPLQQYCIARLARADLLTPASVGSVAAVAAKLAQPRIEAVCRRYVETQWAALVDARTSAVVDQWGAALVAVLAARITAALGAVCDTDSACARHLGQLTVAVALRRALHTGAHAALGELAARTVAAVFGADAQPPTALTAPAVVEEYVRALVGAAGLRDVCAAGARAWDAVVGRLLALGAPLTEPARAVRREVPKKAWRALVAAVRAYICASDRAPPVPGESAACPVCGAPHSVFRGRVPCALCGRLVCRKCVSDPCTALPPAAASSSGKVCGPCNSVLEVFVADAEQQQKQHHS